MWEWERVAADKALAICADVVAKWPIALVVVAFAILGVYLVFHRAK